MHPGPIPGLTQWFVFEDRETVRRCTGALIDLKVRELRVLFSWADWCREDGPAWFDWFVGELAVVPGLTLFPSLFYTPPSLARKDAEGHQMTSYPPEDLAAYEAFVRTMIGRYGTRFNWIQLWNEPNWNPYWSWDLDPQGDLFAEMVIPAAKAARALGKKVVLGGTTPLDYAWLARMEELGVLASMDAISFHYSPSWDNQHRRWLSLATEIRAGRALLAGFKRETELWIDEIGFSTYPKNHRTAAELEREQVSYFDEVRLLPADRIYWFCCFDQKDDTPTDDELNTGDERDLTAYHFGLMTADGRPKLLYGHWRESARADRAPR